jgi:orotidine-5'-phosphate decarboxylase
MILEKLEQRIRSANSLLCIGLDPQIENLPVQYAHTEYPLFCFNRDIIDATQAYAAAYKPNLAFYEAHGEHGWHELRETVNYLRANHPEIIIIADAKRGDVDHTNERYARAIFDDLGCDAITLNPYLGKQSLMPFLSRKDKASIILCRTSNTGAGEIQDLDVAGKPLWQHVAHKVAHEWNENENCMLVVGATYPDEIRQVRAIAPRVPLLVPGVGAQGGDLEKSVRYGVNVSGTGLLINVGRSLIYHDHPAKVAQELRDSINGYRNG